MADWDADSDQLRINLRGVLSAVRDDAARRAELSVETARAWHREMMAGLESPMMEYVGRFRGEAGLEGCGVRIGQHYGVRSDDVGAALTSFERRLQTAVSTLDALIAPGQEPNADHVAAAIDLCAWAHSEWVRIHPFANGNGRTARLWANAIAMRYELPPFVQLRPRPDDGYAAATTEAMKGRWEPTALVFRRMYTEAIRA